MKGIVYYTVVVIYAHLDALIMDEIDLNKEIPDSLVDALARLHSEAKKYIDNQIK